VLGSNVYSSIEEEIKISSELEYNSVEKSKGLIDVILV